MKKKKTISIKNPRLREIRNNLRALLIEWKIHQWNQLNDEYTRIHYDQDGRVRHSKEYTLEEREIVRVIQKKMKRLNDIVTGSICKCSVCGASDKDMTYNPVTKEWFCVDCYKLNQDFYKDTDKAYLYP
ncbi:MAG: hypothetical protein ACXAEX_22445 [Promethearchaeota archaeon]|jgi:signal recognition particle subunit SEC65